MSLEMNIGMQITYGTPGETERTKMRKAEIAMTFTEVEWRAGREHVMRMVADHIDALFDGTAAEQQAMRVACPREKLP